MPGVSELWETIDKLKEENTRLNELNRELTEALEVYMGVPTLGQCIDAENVLKKVKQGE